LYGQFGIILPDENIVVAITEESYKTQQTLDFVWDFLLPGLQKSVLPANSSASQTLKNKTKNLKVKFAEGAATSPVAAAVSSKRFVLDDNKLNAKAVTFNISNSNCELIVHYDNGDRKLNYGINTWEKAKNGKIMYAQLPFPVPGLPNVSTEVAGIATWKNANTLYLQDRPVETVNNDSLTCTFEGNTVKLVPFNSVAEGKKQPETRPVLTGKIA